MSRALSRNTRTATFGIQGRSITNLSSSNSSLQCFAVDDVGMDCFRIHSLRSLTCIGLQNTFILCGRVARYVWAIRNQRFSNIAQTTVSLNISNTFRTCVQPEVTLKSAVKSGGGVESRPLIP
jgi:hypothetical protein